MLGFERMKKKEMAEDMARQSGVAPAVAADQMDRGVYRILRALRSGHSARLPGVGTITPGKHWTFRPESDGR